MTRNVESRRKAGSDPQGLAPNASSRPHPLFAPASVAVIGASPTPEKQGNVAIRYLKRAGFASRIYPVNPAGGEIEGLRVFTPSKTCPNASTRIHRRPAAAVTPAVVHECAEAGLGAIIIGASGFAEMGNDAGRQRQAEIAEIARAAGMIVLGPNTNGIWNRIAVSPSASTPRTASHAARPGSVAAHSGALFDSLFPGSHHSAAASPSSCRSATRPPRHSRRARGASPTETESSASSWRHCRTAPAFTRLALAARAGKPSSRSSLAARPPAPRQRWRIRAGWRAARAPTMRSCANAACRSCDRSRPWRPRARCCPTSACCGSPATLG